uniref:Uncharacterized protein n=1 Tax=Panagrolaimus sp. ES5 TaxID=591445 RepID=A0AC34GA79_9BILA
MSFKNTVTNPSSGNSERTVPTRNLLFNNLPPQRNVIVPPPTHQAFFSAFPSRNDASYDLNKHDYGQHHVPQLTYNHHKFQQDDGSVRPRLEYRNPNAQMFPSFENETNSFHHSSSNTKYHYDIPHANDGFQNQHFDNSYSNPKSSVISMSPSNFAPKPPPRSSSLNQPVEEVKDEKDEKKEKEKPAYLNYFQANSPSTNSRPTYTSNYHHSNRKGLNGTTRGIRGRGRGGSYQKR